MSKNNIPTQDVIGAPICTLTFDEHISLIIEWAKAYQSKMVCVSNVHMLIEAWEDSYFAEVLKNADLVTPDGMPLVWMLRTMGAKQSQRVAGIDIFCAVCEQASIAQVSIFLLGSKPDVLDKICQRLKSDFPLLKVAGLESPPFSPLSPTADISTVQKINASGAGIVFVSLGCPKQELWMSQYQEKVQAVMIGVGAVFPVYAGVLKQAPEFLQSIGFEWLFRLLQEPKRLWKRYLTTIPIFIYLALKQISFKKNPIFK
jgi:N-acetylglucosaminyldiphosphoundecaprenol N-acetyl-beta-D-mannosaminyltransferase